MSCHFSCSSCSGTTFTDCLACSAGSKLASGACFCSTQWDSACSQSVNFMQFYESIQSSYTVLFALVMFLFCLKVRLPYSYRIVAGLQGLGLLVFSSQIYFYFSNQFGLRMLARSNGYYNYSSRLQGLSINYALGSFVLLGCFFVAYFALFPLTVTFGKVYEGYSQYLQDNLWHFLNSFYYFGSRMMLYFVGLWIKSNSTQLGVIIPFCIFGLIILVVLVKLFYDFHKGNIGDQEVHEPELYLYSMLSSSSMAGLPFVTSTTLYIVIYLVPLGLLLLVMLLNRGFEVCIKSKIGFYFIEMLIAGLIVGFILAPDPYRSYILVGTICLGVLGIIIEMSFVYYSGVSFERSSKVSPEPVQQNDNGSVGQWRSLKKVSKTGVSAKNYF